MTKATPTGIRWASSRRWPRGLGKAPQEPLAGRHHEGGHPDVQVAAHPDDFGTFEVVDHRPGASVGRPREGVGGGDFRRSRRPWGADSAIRLPGAPTRGPNHTIPAFPDGKWITCGAPPRSTSPCLTRAGDTATLSQPASRRLDLEALLGPAFEPDTRPAGGWVPPIPPPPEPTFQ